MDVQEKFRIVGEIEKLAQEIAKFLETKNISVGHAFSALAIEIVRLSKVMGMPPDAFNEYQSLISLKKRKNANMYKKN